VYQPQHTSCLTDPAVLEILIIGLTFSIATLLRAFDPVFQQQNAPASQLSDDVSKLAVSRRTRLWVEKRQTCTPEKTAVVCGRLQPAAAAAASNLAISAPGVSSWATRLVVGIASLRRVAAQRTSKCHHLAADGMID